MKVEWSNNARRHLAAIRDYIATDSSRHAQRVIESIIRRTEQLEVFPWAGSVVEEFEDDSIREVFVYSYRIIFKVGADYVQILAVFHSARQLPPTVN